MRGDRKVIRRYNARDARSNVRERVSEIRERAREDPSQLASRVPKRRSRRRKRLSYDFFEFASFNVRSTVYQEKSRETGILPTTTKNEPPSSGKKGICVFVC